MRGCNERTLIHIRIGVRNLSTTLLAAAAATAPPNKLTVVQVIRGMVHVMCTMPSKLCVFIPFDCEGKMICKKRARGDREGASIGK